MGVTNAAFDARPPGEVNLELLGAAHLAFSDLGTLDLGALADELSAGRPDVNALFLDQLVQLGSDGCPPAVPLAELEGCESTEFLDGDVGAHRA